MSPRRQHRRRARPTARGKLTSQTDARNHVTLNEHDVMGRRTAKQLPLGQRKVKTYAVTGQLEKHWPFGANSLAPAEAISHGYETGTDRLLSAVHSDGLEINRTYDDDSSVLSADHS